MTKEVWIVVGKVTDPDSLHYGEAEYQFSDAPPGERGSSADYVTLSKGLKDHSGCIIHWAGERKAYRVEVTIRETRTIYVATTAWATSKEEAVNMARKTEYDDFEVESLSVDDWEVYAIEATEI